MTATEDTKLMEFPHVAVRKGSRYWIYNDAPSNWSLVERDDDSVTIENARKGRVTIEYPDEVLVMHEHSDGIKTIEVLEFDRSTWSAPTHAVEAEGADLDIDDDEAHLSLVPPPVPNPFDGWVLNGDGAPFLSVPEALLVADDVHHVWSVAHALGAHGAPVVVFGPPATLGEVVGYVVGPRHDHQTYREARSL